MPYPFAMFCKSKDFQPVLFLIRWDLIWQRRNRSRLQEMARHAFHAEYLGSLPDMHKKCAMPSDFLTRGKEILPICRTILMPAKETE